MPTRLMSDEAFHEAAKSGAAPADARLRKGFTCEIRAEDGDSRALDFIISTDAVDRMGDVIAVDGWKLEQYRKNPVVLWAHDSGSLPVARATNVRIEEGKLRARAEFVPRQLSRFADTVFEMLKGGFLNATSVGFMPVKYAFVDDPDRRYGIDFLEQELLEFSIVPIPANPEALIEGRSAGIDIEPILGWARHLLSASRPAGKLSLRAPKIDPDECPNDDCPMRSASAATGSDGDRTRARALVEVARLRMA